MIMKGMESKSRLNYTNDNHVPDIQRKHKLDRNCIGFQTFVRTPKKYI